MLRTTRYLFPVMLMALASCSDNTGNTLTFTGIMDATTVRVSAEVPGRILAINCDEGATVQRGDTLAWIDTDRLDLQASQQDAMMSELDFQLRSARERRNAASIQRDNLSRKVARFTSLLNKQAATRQMVDDLTAQLEAADADLRAADEALTALGSKRALINAGKGLVEKQRGDARISSPLSGTVVIRYAEAGEVLGVGSPVCEIANLNEMWTRIYLASGELPHLALGQAVTVRADGMDTPLYGRISWISDKAEFTPKTILTEDTRASLVFAAKVTIPNPDRVLKIGMPVTVSAEKVN